VAMGWLAWKIRKAERQRQAVEAIQKAGGEVLYASDEREQKPSVAARLEELFGRDFVSDVTFARLPWGAKVDGSLSDHLQGLTDLNYLDLSGTDITDAGLEKLRSMARLKGLALCPTRITDRGLESLAGSSRLEDLRLGGWGITDAGLKHVCGLTRLRTLVIRSAQITDAGLKHLTGLRRLERLDLIDSGVTEKGAAEFRKALPDCDVQWASSR